MTKSGATAIVLGVLLLGTNGWWLYNSIDAGITYTYQQVSLDDCHEQLSQTVAILPIVASLDATPEEIIRAAQEPIGAEPFEKEGFTIPPAGSARDLRSGGRGRACERPGPSRAPGGRAPDNRCTTHSRTSVCTDLRAGVRRECERKPGDLGDGDAGEGVART